jgi:hypothetical protein
MRNVWRSAAWLQELTLSFVPDAEQRLGRTVMSGKYQITCNRVQLHSLAGRVSGPRRVSTLSGTVIAAPRGDRLAHQPDRDPGSQLLFYPDKTGCRKLFDLEKGPW